MSATQDARQAASRGDHQEAYALLTEADASEPLGSGDLALLAEVAYALGHVEVTFEAWERSHARAVADEAPVAAAAAAAGMAMQLLMDTGLLAPVRVWTTRAEQLLDGQPTTPVHAVLAVARGYERLLSGDFPAARRLAHQAVELGTAQAAAAPAALGRVMQARSAMFDGDVAQGLRLLDESAAVAISDELDPLSVGLVYCELVCAWQGLAQHDRAEQLTEAMQRWCQRHQGLGSVHGRCRVHRAEMLRLRGHLEDAEHEAQQACEELEPYLRREFGWPLTELGLVRLRRGDLDGAEEAFVRAHESGWDPQPGLALLRLEQGDVGAALAMIEDALDRPAGVPSKEQPPNTELRRAPLLAARIETGVDAGSIERGRSAADELERIATTFASPALQASAAGARGTVELAAGNTDAARHKLQEAVDGYQELAMPYEAARARGKLARVYEQQGDDELASLELRAAAAACEQIGAAAPAPRDAEATATSGPAPRDQPGGSHAVHRFRAEGDCWSITFDGQTVRLRELKGLRYLARLLADPGREFHVLDLVAAEHSLSGSPAPGPATERHQSELPVTDGRRAHGGDAGAVLDEQAKAAYRRRLAEIEDDLEEARGLGDDERTARASAEREFLVQELSRAVGLGGRDRRAASDAERARVSVTRTVRYALDRIRQHHPSLGAHLDHAVRTGTYMSYQPDPQAQAEWEV